MQTRELTRQPTAVQRVILLPEQRPAWVLRAAAEVADFLYHHRIAALGYPYARWHVLFDGLIGVEAGFPVPAPIRTSGPIEGSTLPAGPVVVAWHSGPEEKIGLAYQEIDHWLHAEYFDRNGDAWEVYHDLPTCDPDHRHLEVVQPFSLATIAV